MIPVLGLGVVDTEAQSLLRTLLGELLDDVSLERRGVHDIVVTRIRIKQSKSVMVLGGDDHVLHACLLGDRHPLCSIEFRGVELRRQRLPVYFTRNLCAVHHPFRTSSALLLAVVLALPFAAGNGV